MKILEGTISLVPLTGGRKHPEQKTIEFDTTNVLFICGGTFVGLHDIISKRIGQKRIGFTTENNRFENMINGKKIGVVLPA